MRTLEEELDNIKKEIAEAKEEIKQAKDGGRSEAYLMKLYDNLKADKEIFKLLQEEKLRLLPSHGNHCFAFV
jgi:archaellum component FlaC